MKLSVLISAYNDDELTVVHVRECMESTLMPDEIIVVDDGGELGLKEKLQKLEMKTKVIYVRILEDIPWNYTGARNLGIWLSTGDFIAVEDNDHIPHKDFYKEASELLESKPEVGKVYSHRRDVIELDDILNKPIEEWNPVGTRIPHQDVSMMRRDVFLKTKGYDERFAGAYGWSSTDWKRRTAKAGIESDNIGFYYVVNSPKTTGLSSRNWQMARRQTEIQSEHGILNFRYEYEQL